MRQLLQPEADRAKPLVLGRRAVVGNLEPILDLQIREMRLHHTEHGAAIVIGRHPTAQTDARFDARGRPHITA